jgi:hypothetical protein
VTPRRSTAAPNAGTPPSPSIAAEVAAFFRMDEPALRAAYRELHGVEPKARSRTWIAKACARRLQLNARPGEPAPAQRHDGPLRPGVVLVRVWHGVEHRVQVTDQGFVHAGVPYRSLSAVARAITGQHWSGQLFFGLRDRSRKRP